MQAGDEITITHGPSGVITVQMNDDAPVTAPFTVAEPLFPAVSMGDNMHTVEIDCDPPFSFDQTVIADRSRDTKAVIHRSIQLVNDNDKIVKCRDYSTGATAIATVKGVSVDAPPELAPFVRLYFSGRPPSTVRKAMEKLGFNSKEVAQLLERCE